MLWKNWPEDFPELSNSCESVCFPQLCWKYGLWEIWKGCFWHYFTKKKKKKKWLSFENSLSVISRSTPCIPLKYINPNNSSIWTLFVFLTHVYFLHSLKLSLHSKHAIVSIIFMFVQSTIFTMVSLSKYKSKVSSMLSIFSLSVSGHWMIWAPPKFLFCLSLDQDNHRVLPKHHLCSYIWFICNCFHLMNCKCRERFD